MITINLLPPEFRVQHGPSSKQMLVIVASVCIGLLPGIYFLYVHFVSLANMEENVRQAQKTKQDLEKFEKENENLQKLIASFKVRDQAIDSVKALRISFSRKLHQFATLLQRDNHPVWITSLNIAHKSKVQEQKKGASKGASAVSQTNTSPQFEWKSPCICASDYLNQPNAFYGAIKQNKEFSRDIVELDVFRYNKQTLPKGFSQEIAWQFELKMLMQIVPPVKDTPKEPNAAQPPNKN